MTWIGQWLQSLAGAWFGSDEPEAPGAMRATLRGASSVTGSLSASSEPIIVDISADLNGTGSCTLQIPSPSGGAFGIVRKIRTIWKPDQIIINIAADLHGSGIIKGSTGATVGMVAAMSGSSSVQAISSAKCSLSADLYGSSNVSGGIAALKHVQHPVIADMTASIQGNGGTTATLEAVQHKPATVAADNHDEEMTMILLLAA